MIFNPIKAIVGSRNERLLRRMGKTVKKINVLEPEFQALSDEGLRAKTDAFRQRYQNGEDLDSLLPEAFAAVREASVRTLGFRPFDVQLIGGMVLHTGKIAEMRTGEGKTLVATLPVYLNALTGKGVHIITVNDYLARRDAEWMGPIYNFLGLTVGVILTNQPHEEKRAAYAAGVTYGTNNEFGFDYLRDNMAQSLEEKVQRELHYAIVDEVDSILIDEARTPLIISGASDESSELYAKIDALVPRLKPQKEEDGPGDYSLDEKVKQAFLTEDGHQRVERLFLREGLIQKGESLYSPSNIILMHHLGAALRAHALFHRDVDYIVQDNEIIIVDEHTGRTMPGRRWSDGLHQAIEAKEKVKVQSENQTLASITFQNYFRLYDKLSGMTGTADTEAYEFHEIYGLEVVVIPTHKPMVRDDRPDQVYLTGTEKFSAVIKDIKHCLTRKQPVLVGTASIETSEYLSDLLNKEKVEHQVLNAKHHESEAHIVTQAGQPGTVTIATNMAGRGTDIVLGGSLDAEIKALENPSEEGLAKLRAEWQKRHELVIAAGGLHIVGSERHESRRIDNQLRGRSGRQGDPGSSRFYLSLEDNLMRIFAPERMAGIMKRLGMKEGEAIEHKLVTRAIENAQRKVEGHNFDIRKHLLEFDDVANDQRKMIYAQRDEILAADDIHEIIDGMRESVLTNAVLGFVPPQSIEDQWDIKGLEQQLAADFGIKLPVQQWLDEDASLHDENLRERVVNEMLTRIRGREGQFEADAVRQAEKGVMLYTLDSLWKEHLAAMEHLRQGIHLRGYGQKDPKQEFKREAFEMFKELLENIKYNVITSLAKMEIQAEEDLHALETRMRGRVPSPENMQYEHQEFNLMQGGALEEEAESAPPEPHEPYIRETPKVGRNELCPCGSGKKYKHCHGKVV